ALTPPTATGALPQPLALSAVQAVRTGSWTGAAAALAQDFLRWQLLSRLKWGLALVFVLGTTAGAGTLIYREAAQAEHLPDNAGSTPVAIVAHAPRLDQDGDPLPEGAVLRLGSARFRGGAKQAAFSTDGRTLMTIGGSARTWDAMTGRPLVTTYHPDLRAGGALS